MSNMRSNDSSGTVRYDSPLIWESGGDRSEPTYRPKINERGRVECIAHSVSAALVSRQLTVSNLGTKKAAP